MDGVKEPAETDFFDSSDGLYSGEWRGRARAKDLFFDVRLHLNPCYHKLRSKIKNTPVRNILLAGIERPGEPQRIRDVMQALARTRHRISGRIAPMGAKRGKYHNINRCLEGISLEAYDWLIVIDDDIVFPKFFLDTFIYLAEYADLHICQPAHKFRSFQSFMLTRRHWNSFVRPTGFVECGPFTAFRREMFSHILPFPNLRWAWGVDILWSEIAYKLGVPIGIVDATLIQHIRPVASSYDMKAAREEAAEFLKARGVTRERKDILRTIEVISKI